MRAASSTSSSQRKPRLTRRRILRAALRLVDRKGASALTMRNLAEELGAAVVHRRERVVREVRGQVVERVGARVRFEVADATDYPSEGYDLGVVADEPRLRVGLRKDEQGCAVTGADVGDPGARGQLGRHTVQGRDPLDHQAVAVADQEEPFGALEGWPRPAPPRPLRRGCFVCQATDTAIAASPSSEYDQGVSDAAPPSTRTGRTRTPPARTARTTSRRRGSVPGPAVAVSPSRRYKPSVAASTGDRQVFGGCPPVRVAHWCRRVVPDAGCLARVLCGADRLQG